MIEHEISIPCSPYREPIMVYVTHSFEGDPPVRLTLHYAVTQNNTIVPGSYNILDILVVR